MLAECLERLSVRKCVLECFNNLWWDDGDDNVRSSLCCEVSPPVRSKLKQQMPFFFSPVTFPCSRHQLCAAPSSPSGRHPHGSARGPSPAAAAGVLALPARPAVARRRWRQRGGGIGARAAAAGRAAGPETEAADPAADPHRRVPEAARAAVPPARGPAAGAHSGTAAVACQWSSSAGKKGGIQNKSETFGPRFPEIARTGLKAAVSQQPKEKQLKLWRPGRIIWTWLHSVSTNHS